MGANQSDPHAGQPIETAGAPPRAATAAVVMLHGRGSTASVILRLVDEIYRRGVIYVAPQAAGRRWYPRSAYAPPEANEPWFGSARSLVSRALETAADAGISPERTLLFGFSQGGCLASEFVARNPRRYGGLVALSASLMGPETGRYGGTVDGTPAFFGCSDDDPYVPGERVRESAATFERLGAAASYRLYEELGHAINDDEIRRVQESIDGLVR